MDIKVLIVDDHKIMREGLRKLLRNKSNINVVGEAENGREALKMAKAYNPNIVLMDVLMPELNGIEATKTIVNDSPGTKVIALSSHGGKEFVTGMLGAGASGYLLKDCAFDELVDAIESVNSKHTYLSREIADIVVNEYVTRFQFGVREKEEELTSREREVLQLISEGYSTRQIAESLFVSIKTIESHRQRIMQKLNLFSVPELTKHAIKMGLTALEK
ncbi:MAG: response regulator transcription factor [Prolixibacteraceae bacterium]|nr:response regulator transcription factor [Prolixibacteraceae bacterium]MBN2775220.1 response regulator transcription factor [Prolixibacteraceae bacterium]